VTGYIKHSPRRATIVPGTTIALGFTTLPAHVSDWASRRFPANSAAAPGACGSTAVSDRMSIRQPVSFAANRAFWPSLPIASESW
jgi:hypothetical protein